MRTLQSCSIDEARATARLLEMEVLPTPPLPPTKTTGVSAELLEIWDWISSRRGFNEKSDVDDVCHGDESRDNRDDDGALTDVERDERDRMTGRCAWCEDLGLQNADTSDAQTASDIAMNRNAVVMVSVV